MSESKQQKSELTRQINLLNQQYSDLKQAVSEIKMQLNNIMLQNQGNTTGINILRANTQNFYNELWFANLLHDTIIQSPWLKDKTFSLFGGAANYSFIYSLYRILDKVNPTNILEMGLGQTTRLTSQYIAYKNPAAHLTVCEHNLEWIDIYTPELPDADNIDIKHFDLEYFMQDGKQNDKYSGLSEYVKQQKYDLIIIDGPIGYGKNLPRTNIFDLINNNNLADDFILIFDDAERAGEQATIAYTETLLHNKGVNFASFARYGSKKQYFITSQSRSFIHFL
ncbi:MAG: hypothetical protein IKR92_05725 [Alphaproteobacteria bacterium]|nr:hypothetical protein [Alphaproteobacteria bacterium]